jgi:hypothetical protein
VVLEVRPSDDAGRAGRGLRLHPDPDLDVLAAAVWSAGGQPGVRKILAALDLGLLPAGLGRRRPRGALGGGQDGALLEREGRSGMDGGRVGRAQQTVDEVRHLPDASR